jgi:electron transfer flavoprotein beta subunit
LQYDARPMKVAVCVKHVPVGTLRMQSDSGHLDRNGPGELNAVDKNAIEAALRFKDDEGAEVLLLSVGPEAATESLRTGLGMGADRAILVSDAAAAGSDLLGTSRILAQVLAREGADLVLFGQQTSDGGGALLWAAIAERLQLPFVSQASSINLADGGIEVARETEVGVDVIHSPLPALVAVSDAINEPRYASLKGMMAAKKKPLDVLTLADLELDAGAVGGAGARTSVRSVGSPPTRPGCETVEDDGHAAEAVYDYLAARQLV